MWTFLALLLCSPAEATELDLEVVGVEYDLTQTTRARIRRNLTRMIGYFERSLDVSLPEKLDVHVTIHRDRESYFADGGSPTTLGYYTYSPPRAVLWANESTDKMMAVFLHETSHFLLGYGKRRSPRWANEGLAQCFGGSRIEGNGMYMHPKPIFLQYLEWERKQGTSVSVREVVAHDGRWGELPEGEVQVKYVHAWALTHFLLSSDRGRKLFTAILEDYRKTRNASRGLVLMEERWPQGVDALQRQLNTWIAEGPQPLQVPLVIETRDDDDNFVRCPDGRLVARDNPEGCKTWRIQPDGTLVLE